MSTPAEASVERFLRRIEGTDEETLQRNLRAGVYGPPGSSRHAAAERAIQSQIAGRARRLAEHSPADPLLLAEANRARAWAKRAVWIATLALLVAALAALRSFGLL